MYKMLVLDMDDTLLDDELHVSDENVQAILQAKEMGVEIVFCSGRADKSMMNYIEALNIHDEHEFFVSYNGAKIDRLDGKVLFYKPLEGELLRELVALGREWGLDTQLYQELMIAEGRTERIEEYERLSGVHARIVDSLDEIDSSIKVLYNSLDKPLLEKLQKEVLDRYGDRVNAFFSKPFYLEVLDKDANKGKAVEFLAKKLGIRQEEIIAMGDSYNDLFMISYAGLGVAVGNAHPEIKGQADYVTEATNNDSAVAEVVRKFLLPKKQSH
ncbi:Cof-type HAD-IIB family hydrolase [Anaerotalea alkaliphila]|uniref:HAD family phosphatase n=1 Tax=Anaerotalea alkaliphila TaxID=2662126 RepID=A0A7X5HWS9_9FIRM|nr:Cof-type HAD-IIB family hydrolase [Anaerotalea alkaliphila]NDL68077.1 HAD family phosphatase [Anaerotalea alkaliphila]